MAIVLGIVMEVLVLGVGAAFGTNPEVKRILADSAQKVSWSVIVCGGLAIGTAAARVSAGVMGVLGAISGPVGFISAKAVHKGLATAMGLTPPGGPSAVTLAVVKGAEYALLGIMLATILRRLGLNLKGYIAAGVVVGVVFGSVTLWLMVSAANENGKPLSTGELTVRAVNEIAFPVGCSMVLYALSRLASVPMAMSGGAAGSAKAG